VVSIPLQALSLSQQPLGHRLTFTALPKLTAVMWVGFSVALIHLSVFLHYISKIDAKKQLKSPNLTQK